MGRRVAVEDAQKRGRAVAALGIDGLGRRVRVVAAHERQATAEVHSLGVHPRAVERSHHAIANGVAVEGRLDLEVHALEALLGKAEAGGVLVEALEHRPERRLGLFAAQPVDSQPRRGTRTELPAGRRAGVELAQPIPAFGDVWPGARLVAIEDRPAAVTLVDDVELDLGSRAKIIGEERRGLQREVPQRGVEGRVAHRREFASRGPDPARRSSSTLSGSW